MKVEVQIVNAFVDENVGGNPAGVVLNAHQYTRGEKQRITAAVGLSETAFVSPSSIANFKLEFFTPTRQIAHCGHATIATFGYLRQTGALPNDQTSKETIDGRREILMEDDYAYMEQLAPRYTELSQEHRLCVLDSLGLKPSDLLADAQPCVVNTGNSFLVIALRNSDIIKFVNPNKKFISVISEKYDLIGYYAFSPETVKEGRDAGARMFAPRYGINEESATGMAAGPLACYLYDKLKNEKREFLIEQGHLMFPGSPSVITVRLRVKDGSISSLMAGGKAAVSKVRYVEI
ncbi:MAG: PhzF family phenazine biosynthesis protein [SAR324 cluster bacterium]|nr:PhzF family phenazine biosynthesis protein [SAR324 cluster bacterium]